MRLQKREALGRTMNADWPFDQTENTAIITTRAFIDGDEPITYASHDADDHGWQFLTATYSVETAAVVGLGEIAKMDPTLLQIAHIEPGWYATRECIGANWSVERSDD